MNILSLFDGMSCGQIALNKLGITDYTYYASEIDKYAIQVTQKNYPNTIQIGDVTKVNGIHKNGENGLIIIPNIPKIDLLIGGSPCQGFSFAGKQLNFNDERSKLFFEFVRLVNETKPRYFLLENVKMKKEYQDVISEHLYGIEPIEINSSLVSAQNRKRLYWIGELQEDGTYKKLEVSQPQDKGILLKDILENYIDEKYFISSQHINSMIKSRNSGKLNIPELHGKCGTLIAGYYKIPQDGPYINEDLRGYGLYGHNNIRKLTPIECERLQTVPDNYTDSVSNSQRYKMLGNGWTVDVIAHIFSFMKLK